MDEKHEFLEKKLSLETEKTREACELTQYILDTCRDSEKNESLAPLLDTREGILREIVENEETILDELRKTGKNMQYLDAEFPEEMQSIRSEILRIKDLDTEIAKELTDRKNKIIKELKQIKVGQILPDQYKKHENGGSSFVNIRE